MEIFYDRIQIDFGLKKSPSGQIERIVTNYFVILALQCISGSHTQEKCVA